MSARYLVIGRRRNAYQPLHMATVKVSTAILADVPHLPNDVEDYVAALFQAAGYYVEKNIIEQAKSQQVLELDAVVTDYSTGVPASVVVEAKSADAGFPEAFKLLGWMTYLGISRGVVFTTREGHASNFINERLNPLGLSYCVLGDCSHAFDRFEACGFPKVTDAVGVDLWRRSYGMERRLLYDLRTLVKTDTSKLGPVTVQEYIHVIRDEVFFESDARQRALKLYDKFGEHPKLSLGCATELAGEPFDPQGSDPDNPFMSAAMLKGEHLVLQASFYAEHRAKLAILKAAIDLYAKSCVDKGGPESESSNWTTMLALPSSFRTALHTLSQDEFFFRYALFWQVFLWGWGGFYLEDRKQHEFDLLSAQTGIPATEIPNALRAMDVLFPPGPWIAQAGPSEVRLVKMVPFCMRAIGAYQRRLRYKIGGYAELKYDDYTGRDLQRWHNAGITFWNKRRNAV